MLKQAHFERAAIALAVLFVFFFSNSGTVPSANAQQPKALLLFGDDEHKTFLGCLNCSELNEVSVCKDLGKYGSNLQTNSIWNSFGTFGSDFSPVSPWNSFGTDAPIIVDNDGKSYGYFIANAFHKDRTRIDWLVKILDYHDDKSDLDETRKLMCGHHCE